MKEEKELVKTVVSTVDLINRIVKSLSIIMAMLVIRSLIVFICVNAISFIPHVDFISVLAILTILKTLTFNVVTSSLPITINTITHAE